MIALTAGLISSGLYPMAFWIYGKIVTAFVSFGIQKQNLANIQKGLPIQNSTWYTFIRSNEKQIRFPNLYFYISILKFSIGQNIPADFQVDVAVYEYIYYYVYFGFPILVAHLVAYFCWGLAAERTATKMRSALYSTLITQDLNWFENFGPEETNALYS